MKGLLVRVGIDATAGGWNGPVDPATGSFVYVPIPETQEYIRLGLGLPYKEIIPALSRMKEQLPRHLQGRFMHLDPDFAELTYGDCHPRSLPIIGLTRGDFLVFYASLRSITNVQQGLLYAIIGFFLIEEVVSADEIPRDRWHQNAHTRRTLNQSDTVVRAQRGKSGRLTHCISIGEYRQRAYRVRRDILTAWGGLSVTDGFIQRSARLPFFKNPYAFLKWFESQKPELLERNNP